MARRQQMTTSEQMLRIAKVIKRDLPDHELVNYYYMRFDRPMRVTVRDKASGEITLRELGPDYRTLQSIS